VNGTACARCGGEHDVGSDCPARREGTPPPAGTEILLGRYRVGALIARGAMGDVFEGWDLAASALVAVKMLGSGVEGDTEVAERFRREAQVLASLAHPNVVPVHAVGEHRGRPFIVMRRLRGQTLAERIAAGPLPLGSMVSLGAQVCDGLERIHAAGFVHRDIKPANLMIEPDGSCCLLDLGILRSLGEQVSEAGSLVGTPDYMAPEQARDAGLADPRSDLYSLGATLFAAVTGEPPRGSRRRVPPEAAGFFARALAAEPGHRFTTAREMKEALLELAGGPAPPPDVTSLPPAP
jgi:serine/threonine protein kinase